VNETKAPRKRIVLDLGIICIILVACLAGVIIAFEFVVNDKNNTVSSLNKQIAELNSTLANLQGQVASENSTITSLTSQVANLQKQLNLNITSVNYTVVGILSYANVSAVYPDIIVDSIVPSYAPNLVGSFTFLTFNGQMSPTFPSGFVDGDLVAVIGTISFSQSFQTFFLNWNSATLCNVTVTGVDEQADSRLTMTLQNTNFSFGEPISLTLTLTNISNQTIEYGWDSLMFDFRVYNSTNSNLYDWWDTQAFVNLEFTTALNPGESISSANVDEALIWPQTYNPGPVSEGSPVSPGTYYIVGYAMTSPFVQTSSIQLTIS